MLLKTLFVKQFCKSKNYFRTFLTRGGISSGLMKSRWESALIFCDLPSSWISLFICWQMWDVTRAFLHAIVRAKSFLACYIFVWARISKTSQKGKNKLYQVQKRCRWHSEVKRSKGKEHVAALSVSTKIKTSPSSNMRMERETANKTRQNFFLSFCGARSSGGGPPCSLVGKLN